MHEEGGSSGIFHDVEKKIPAGVITGHMIVWVVTLFLGSAGIITYVLSIDNALLESHGIRYYKKYDPLWSLMPLIVSVIVQLIMAIVLNVLIFRIPKTILQRPLYTALGVWLLIATLVLLIGNSIPNEYSLFIGNGSEVIYFFLVMISERRLRQIRGGANKHYRSSSGSYIFS